MFRFVIIFSMLLATPLSVLAQDGAGWSYRIELSFDRLNRDIHIQDIQFFKLGNVQVNCSMAHMKCVLNYNEVGDHYIISEGCNGIGSCNAQIIPPEILVILNLLVDEGGEYRALTHELRLNLDFCSFGNSYVIEELPLTEIIDIKSCIEVRATSNESYSFHQPKERKERNSDNLVQIPLLIMEEK